ncbi:CCR4-Not complex subunit Ccr4 [Schizosaccharomyces octosporus yFS286]|uniref:CCR4-Not complex 3'-5'-exoribonuclease subunit Ccr4 n=1 Tax=Schizosaccharomyces octosporus (strain yFS286) TaxID=483514 RepID=S9PVC5_SCHOY|nr:CCR4-Not complex subunit Ccr4 [Schizosaccharomyces octosporus yFS286]EPX71942.1 CCR4-Not complex subunit Ccr4 [Schizosaccharomyces octosporus yFS286]
MFNPRYTQGTIYPGTHPGLLTPDQQHAAILSVHNSPAIENGHISEHWKQQIAVATQSRAFSSPHQRAHNAAALARTSGMNAMNYNTRNGGAAYSGIGANASNALSGRLNSTTVSTTTSNSVGNNLTTASTVVTTTTTKPDDKNDSRQESRQDWTCLDLGGIGLRNVSTDLFKFSFLTELYINHNKLSRLPSEIGKLRNLVILDASGNNIKAIPPELGLLTELREVLLFDNMIAVIPPELGTLYQLKILGVEGNPLQDVYKSQLMETGTTGLITALRDGCPVIPPPPEREWEKLTSDNDDANEKSLMLTSDTEGSSVPKPNESNTNFKFTAMSYNILCERYATSTLYGYTPSWALAWSYRRDLIMQELAGYKADIICLQEVDVENFDTFFAPEMSIKGYKGVHFPKSRVRTMNELERRVVDGCATFFKTSKFFMHEKSIIEFNQAPSLRRQNIKLTSNMYNRVMTKDNISVMTMLESKETGHRLIVANCHIHWDPQFRDVKLMQVAMLMDELAQVATRFCSLPSKLPADYLKDSRPSYSDYTKIPVLICGDFNSVPGSGVLDFLSSGKVEQHHEDFMNNDYGDYTYNGKSHPFNLKSAYSETQELPFTNFTPGFSGTIDYIWYTNANLEATGLLKGVDRNYLSSIVGFPNAHFPSDHICLLAEFKVKQEKGPITNPKFSNDRK